MKAHLEQGTPKHWRSLGERTLTPETKAAGWNEFAPGSAEPVAPPMDVLSRRRFLGLVGATAALAATAACSKVDRGFIVPYTKRPAEVVPGVANYYASTFQEGRRAYSVLVKTREGRPIHITGNDEHPAYKGKTSPRAMADIMRLYDPDRLRGPKIDRKPASWSEGDRLVVDALRAAKATGKAVLLLTGAVPSPTRRTLIAEMKSALPGLEHLAWEPAAGDAELSAARAAFGGPAVVKAKIGQARVILSLGADFLGGDDPEAVGAFAAWRRPRGSGQPMNRLWALEGPMTLTGAKADRRVPVKPSEIAPLAFALARALNDRGVPLPGGVPAPALPPGDFHGTPLSAEEWGALLNDLGNAVGKALVVCGASMPPEAHAAAHLLNAMVGGPLAQARPAEPLASLKDLDVVVRRMATGAYETVIFWGVNPAYAFPAPGRLAAALERVPHRVWMGVLEDETSALCEVVLPEHHWLEAWGDYDDGQGIVSLQQPAVGPLYDTKQGEEVILGWLKGLGAVPSAGYHAYVQARWSKEVYPQGSPVSFERFFEVALHDGFVRAESSVPAALAFNGAAVEAARRTPAPGSAQGFDLVLAPGYAVYDGRYANIGWLQELPDPVTKNTWGNPLSVSVADAEALGLADGDVVKIEAGKAAMEVPVLVQPGQAQGVLVLALGYGRSTGSVATGIGVNAFQLMDAESSSPNLRTGVHLTKTGGRRDLPVTQAHHRMEGRDIVRSYTLAEYAREAVKGRSEEDLVTLYDPLKFPEHKWGMVIDQSACIGCSGCVIACQSENNIAVVGAEQVVRGREMQWIRIDRYYEGDPRRPRTVHQPMLCQQCDDAPCENVCPVNATNHSPDGLNQMVYNRCVGTRYCGNNCPYKVRRFNFFEYTAFKKDPEALAYNPEVTVRPRGVMEKCTFCIQRIEDARMRALGENRPVRDGEIVTACQAACPSDAIVFGDLKDPQSRVSLLSKSDRGYKVLAELGVRPAITYLANLTNPAGEDKDA